MFIYTKELNQYIGNRLQLKRKKMGLSLAKIADHLGVSFQQIHKYESGLSEVSSVYLFEIAYILGVDFNYFFKGFKTFKKRTNFSHSEVIQQDRSSPFNVLLIEDDEASVLLTRKACELSPLEINLYTITDGTRVLDFLKNTTPSAKIPFRRPDIIVLDLNLPKIDGITLLHDIKHDNDLSDIPVIILSSSTDVKDMITCYQDQASGFMCKPFDFDVFEKNIEILSTYWGKTVVLPNRQLETVYNAS